MGAAELGIRPAEAGDAEARRHLLAQLTGALMTSAQMQDRLAWAAQSPIDWVYVAALDGVVCGVLGFRLREGVEWAGRYGEVAVIVTDGATRRRGVGRALMDYAERLAHEHGCRGTWLVSGFGRAEEAHRFYERLGYARTGYRFVKLFDR